jgi:hypothetical protein
MDFDYTTETITPDSTTILTIGGTGALELPEGSTAQEPAGASAGAIRYNTTVPQLEYYNGSAWLPFGGSVTSVQASGGTTGLTFSGGPITTSGTLTLSGTLGAANGGTGATATPTNGQILVGNGTNFVVATLGTGTGISTTVGAGTLQINNTGVTSAVAGTGIGVSSATGAVTFSNTGVLSWSGGTTGLLPSSATTGAVTLTGTLVVGNGGTGATTFTTDGVIYGNGTSALGVTAAGTTGQVLVGNTSAAPSWTNAPAISGANITTGTIPISALTFDTITIGTTPITLGGSATVFTGITSLTLTGAGILTGVTTPVNPSDAVPLSYLQSVVNGLEWKEEAVAATTANLPATYNNGASGVGATLTNSGADAAFSIDGWTPNVGDRVLIKNQTTQAQNGIYVVTTAGNGSTAWVLTRSTDANGSGTPNDLNNATLYITNGTVNANSAWSQTTANPTVGTSPIVFVQSAGAGSYTAGTGLTLTGNVFSISNIGTAGTYGDSTHVPVFTTNAQGQVTAVTNTAIAFPVTSVTGSGAGISVSPTTGAVVVSNTGVTSLAGTAGNITASASTGAVTLNLATAGTAGTYGTVTTDTFGRVTAGVVVSLPANGGTGTGTAPTAGQLLVGVTGGTYIPFTVTSGTGISTTVGSGTFQINNTGVTSNVAGTGITVSAATGASTISITNIGTAGTYGSVTTNAQGQVTAGSVISPVANGGTGAATFTTNGVLFGNGTSAIGVTAAGTTGQVLIATTGAAPSWGTLSGVAVTSVQGTTNEIAVNGVFTAQTGAVVLTTPTTFIAPGSIASTTTITAATGLTLTYATANAFLYSGAASAVLSTAQATNGQLLIGSTGAAPVAAALTAGINTYITNGAGSIAIAGPKYWAESSTAPSTLPSATGNQSMAIGNSAVSTLYGQLSQASGSFGTAGDAQSSTYILRISTTNATPAVMFMDGSAARLVLPVNSAWMFDIDIVARRTDATGTTGAWNLRGLITQDATVATTTLVGTQSRTFIAGSGLTAADVSATADVTNGALQINVTGNGGQTIRWVATARITQVANI